MPDAEPAIPEAVGPPVVPGAVDPEPAADDFDHAGPADHELGHAGPGDPELDHAQPADRELGDELVPAGSIRAASPAGRPKPPSGNRVAAFMRASWAELQRVQWPDRRQVGQATAVVLGFVVIAGSFLGLADLIASNLVDAIL